MKNKTIITFLLLYLIYLIPFSIAGLIEVNINTTFNPIDGGYFIINQTSFANESIIVNRTCVIVDGETNINGINTCGGGVNYFWFNSSVTTTSTTTTLPVPLGNQTTAIIDFSEFFTGYMNSSKVTTICIKVFSLVCFNLTAETWETR